MFKLIASDLDGTLLPPKQGVPEETFEIIEKLHKKGVVFCPASGRQLPNLKVLFGSVLDKIAIIAENGGMAWYGGEVIFSDPTSDESVKYALDIIRRHKGLYPILSCGNCAYYESDHAPFVEVVKAAYSSEKLVKNLDDVLGTDVVYKISVWDEMGAPQHGGVILPPLIKGLRVIVSGRDWLDVSVEGSNKGKALKAIAQKLGVDKAEICAFGDHMNDLELLQESGKAYVTANAYPPLKQMIGEEIPSNADFGVIKILRGLL